MGEERGEQASLEAQLDEFSDRDSVLYVSLDDSNNLESTNSGIVAAAFSLEREDSIFKYFSGRLSEEELYSWMGRVPQSRWYRFSRLDHPRLRKTQPFLTFFAKPLVNSLLSYLDPSPPNLWLCIDGILPRRHKEYLREIFLQRFKKVVVTNVVKRRSHMAARKKDSRVYAPPLLMIANILSNQLYHGSLRQRVIERDPNQVYVDQNQAFRESLELR